MVLQEAVNRGLMVKISSNETFKVCAIITAVTACEKCKMKNMASCSTKCAQSKSVDASHVSIEGSICQRMSSVAL